jgi:hypothetical protein
MSKVGANDWWPDRKKPALERIRIVHFNHRRVL